MQILRWTARFVGLGTNLAFKKKSQAGIKAHNRFIHLLTFVGSLDPTWFGRRAEMDGQRRGQDFP
jgi:hypothetical protein